MSGTLARKHSYQCLTIGKRTVNCTASAPPSVFLLLPCTTSGSSSITLGCLFQRPSASSTFSWHQDGNQLSDKGTSHPNIFTNGMFLQINTLTLPRASWKEDSEYFCKAGTDSNNMKKNKEKDPVSPTVSLLPVSSGDSTPDALICVIRDFYPKTLTVNWKVNSRDQTGSITWQPEKQAPGVYSASSILKVDRTKWDSSEEYTCEVEHQQQNFSQKTSKNMLVEKTCLEVTLKPPRVREMFINNKAVLDCDITGEEQAAVEGATVTWRVDGTEKSEVNTTSVAKQVGHLYRKTSTLTLRQTDWFDGKRVQCSVQQSSDKSPINKDISMGQKNSESPTVLILIPTEKELNGKSDVTLACVVTGTSLRDVYTMWKLDEGEPQEGMTGQPLRGTDGTYSITSLIRITAAQWKKHSFTCAFKHSTAENLSAPVQVTVSREMVQCRLSQFGFSKSCNEEGDEDDELGSLWSTASSFIILFLCTVFYNVILSLIKLKK